MQWTRRANERGQAEHGWLSSRHTFSFANYYDPQFMGFGALRVLNEDRVMPGRGFGEHPHRNMEIISYPVDGALSHRDSMGNGSVIRPGEVQRLTAGTGVTHSEYNHSASVGVHFLQIWIIPDQIGLAPSYEQKMYGERRHNRLCLVASGDGREDSITVHQDLRLFASLLDHGKTLEFEPLPGRMQWIQVVQGPLEIGSARLEQGDALAIVPDGEKSTCSPFVVHAMDDAHFLLFDLATLTH